ncbi:MAG: hypothetical protein AAFY19_01680 [Pseudomonadota bacterium]
MKTKSLLILGAGLGALAAMPGHTQSSQTAALEVQCRATEVTMPDSCPCTITKAREVGVSDAELASLFKDDGHSEPVDQGKYTRFWQVKSQCIADSMMASLGVSQGNPLPGVPPHMRPGMPLSGAAPAPAPAPAATPPPQTARRDLQQPASTTRAGMMPAVEITTIRRDGRDEVIRYKWALQGEDHYLDIASSLSQFPDLVADARAQAEGYVRDALEYDRPEPPGKSYRNTMNTDWDPAEGLGPLLPAVSVGYTNNRPAPQFNEARLYDTRTGKRIGWTDVFEPRVWNGYIRGQYCTGLDAERRKRSTGDFSAGCPEFDKLLIQFATSDSGQKELVFGALAYTAGSYAEGAYFVNVPLDATILAGVKEPYRAIFEAPGAASVSGDVARSSPAGGVFTPIAFTKKPHRRGSNLNPILDELLSFERDGAGYAFLTDPRPSSGKSSVIDIYQFSALGPNISFYYRDGTEAPRAVLHFPGTSELAIRTSPAGDAFEVLATGPKRTELMLCEGNAFSLGGTCRQIDKGGLKFGPAPAGLGPVHGPATPGAHNPNALQNTALVRRLKTVPYDHPSFASGGSCGGIIAAFDQPIDPRSPNEVSDLVKTKGRTIYRWGSDIGRDGQPISVKGILLDGKFVSMPSVSDGVHRSADGRVTMRETHVGPGISGYLSDGANTVVIELTIDGQTASFPAISSGGC